MIIKSISLNKSTESNLRAILLDGEFFCASLEHPQREEKITGITGIPSGAYEVKLKEVLTPMTLRYQKKYDWFEWHLELQDVPNFTDVYIHIGNSVKDSKGCVLVGNIKPENNDYIINSTSTMARFYEKVWGALNSGEKVFFVKD